MKLTSKERNFLRKKAHDLEPIVRIGKSGISDSVIESIKQVIDKQELIKVKILNNSDEFITRELEDNIAKATSSICVSSIGHVMIFFKKRVDEKNNKGPITREFYEFRKRN
ncbi:ribosome assembly RNA-binding protein YhbY [Caviibacter abscessus]|uniref:ribosome assembly RNA-binding protein YhbY n=1 Tax=Caviibacter abscessus TaxID=1766719 RepID=UPI0008333741|nr:ribosome assembly RNA-binding protein YhbY [Caviibacter abscessus]